VWQKLQSNIVFSVTTIQTFWRIPLLAKLHNFPILYKHILTLFYKFCSPANPFEFVDGTDRSQGSSLQLFSTVFILPWDYHGMNFDALRNLTILKCLQLVSNKMNLKNEFRITAFSEINFYQNYKLLDWDKQIYIKLYTNFYVQF
jgi:hypothetical protein